MQTQLQRKVNLFFLVLSMCAFQFVWAQGTVTGKITNAKGEPLSGATLMIGTDLGALSDDDGKFTIDGVPAGTNELVATFIGYLEQKLQVNVSNGGTTTVNLTMEEDIASTEEVVIVGYGTMRKRDLTSSISKVTVVNDNVGQSFETNLQGKAPGVMVTQSSGAAGAGAVIRIRGISSVSASGDPLYVIDGIPVTQDMFLNNNRGGQNNNPLSSINPNDIESIEVLKDAAAAGIYGSRGANGVILVTTKRGTDGKPSFDFSARVGAATPTRLYRMLNNKEWLQMRQEAYENDGGVGRAPLPRNISWEDAENTNTNWIDQTVGVGIKQEYNLTMKQGGKKWKTYLGTSYLNDESYLKGNSYVRYTGRWNTDWTPTKWFTASLNTSLANGINNRVSQAWDEGGFGDALSTLLPIYPADGSLGSKDPNFRREHRKWKTLEWRTINNLTLSLRPVKGLELRGSGNYDFMNLGDNIYEDQTYDQTGGIARAKMYQSKVNNWSANATAQYNFDLNENHTLYVLGGSEIQKSVANFHNIEMDNADRFIYLKPLAIQDKVIRVTKDEIPVTQAWSFLSYFTRLNYAYKNKYFFQGTARADASSRFGANYRTGFFPTVGLGWVLTEEKFLKGGNVVNFFKIKGSWGITGSSNIPNYARFGTYASSGIQYGDQNILFPTNLANPDLRWEKTRTIDGGFEMGLFNDRIQITAEFYDKRTSDLLVESTVQSSSAAGNVSNGFTKYYQNIGQVLNRGAELGVTSHNIDNKNFKWTTILSVARNINKVLDIGKSSPDQLSGGTNDTRIFIGQPIGINYLVDFSHVDTETGRPVYLDKDGKETFEWNEANRQIRGKVLPDFIGGLSNNFTYKNWDLSTLFTFSIGGNIYDASAKRQIGVVTDWNMRPEIFNRWRQPGDVAQYPRLTMNPGTYGLSSEWQYNSTMWLYDASYGRMKNVTLGYNYPMSGKGTFKSMRFTVVGTNLFTLTKYPGLDPEIARDFENPQDRNLSPNITYLTAPQQRAFSVGISLGW